MTKHTRQSLFGIRPPAVEKTLMMGMIETYRQIMSLLDAHGRKRFFQLLAMFCVRGPLEILGIASLIPFLTLVSSPGRIQENQYLFATYNYLGFDTTNSFLLFTGACVFFALLLRLGFQALTQYATIRFGRFRMADLSSRLLRTYLDQPYGWFLNRNSSDLGKSILSEVDHVVKGAMVPSLQLLSQLIAAIFVIALVVVIEPAIAVIAAVVLGSAYGTIYGVSRRYLVKAGADRIEANKERFQIAQESLNGIKEVKILGVAQMYLKSFRTAAHRFARRHAEYAIISQLPSFALQAIVFGGMLVVVLVLLALRGGDLAAALPLIGVFALAGYRLMPMTQQIFRAAAALRFNKPALDKLQTDFERMGRNATPTTRGVSRDKRIKLRENIEFDNVCFSFPQSDRQAIENISLRIDANTTVAFVGPTGAGKTTVVDLMLGLLFPQRGEVRVNGVVINESNAQHWQHSIGYVPQAIFLADDAVAANIALGVPPSKIDRTAVERSARIAKLHDFVVNELPEGYDTKIGERGIRLSGGQRQRIGIARALYHDPDVLILDEATSALDNTTERAVMNAIQSLSRQKTIVLIAHRLTTVQFCDRVFFLEQGKLSLSGTFDELLKKDHGFRSFADTAV